MICRYFVHVQHPKPIIMAKIIIMLSLVSHKKTTSANSNTLQDVSITNEDVFVLLGVWWV